MEAKHEKHKQFLIGQFKILKIIILIIIFIV